MIKFLKSYKTNNEATSAVEFALIAPVILILLIGTMEFGMYIHEKMLLQNTASTVANYIYEMQDDENALEVANETYTGRDASLTLTTEFSCQCSDGIAAECPIDCGESDVERRFVSVSLSGAFTPIFPYPGLPENIAMNTNVRIRVD